jgi:hypothetical protein
MSTTLHRPFVCFSSWFLSESIFRLSHSPTKKKKRESISTASQFTPWNSWGGCQQMLQSSLYLSLCWVTWVSVSVYQIVGVPTLSEQGVMLVHKVRKTLLANPTSLFSYFIWCILYTRIITSFWFSSLHKLALY